MYRILGRLEWVTQVGNLGHIQATCLHYPSFVAVDAKSNAAPFEPDPLGLVLLSGTEHVHLMASVGYKPTRRKLAKEVRNCDYRTCCCCA